MIRYIKRMDYTPFVENGYLSMRGGKRKMTINRFKLIHNHQEHQVYKKGKTIIYVVRGTMNKKDRSTNLFSLFSYVGGSDRFHREHKKLRKVIEDYPGHQIILVGHSLGGRLSIELGEEELDHITEIHVYNPISLPGDLPFNLVFGITCATLGIGTRCKLRSKLYIHRNLIDPVSSGHLLSAVETIVDPTIHNIAGFKKIELYRQAKCRGCRVNEKSSKKDIISAIVES